MENRAKFPEDRTPPTGIGSVLLPRPEDRSTQKKIRASLNASRFQLEEFKKDLASAFQYNLLDRNCVTELIRSVNQSFDGEDETHAFGGHIEPNRSQSFIPFRFHELVKNRYRVTQIKRYPSYLVRARASTSTREDGLDRLSFLEASPITSKIYQSRTREDGAFLLFSDNQFTLRPLIGGINFAYGAGTAVIGTMSAPIDGGSLVMAGLKGMLFSLPELAFWNIRKGTFSEFTLPAEIAAQPHN